MAEFVGYSKAALNASDFDALCDAVFDCAKSLASARASEVPAEKMRLMDATNRLAYAGLSRKNPRLSGRRVKALKYSNEVMARRAGVAA